MDTEPVPNGFTLVQSGQDGLVIHHKRVGMGCIGIFAVCWGTIWTCACVVLLYKFLHGGKMDNGDPIPIGFVLVFWAGDLLVLGAAAAMLFCTKSFRIDYEKLVVDTTLFGFKRTKTIPRSSIRKVIQVKDGGDDAVRVSIWGLKIDGDKNTRLIFRQPHENSRWLGQILARWANVEFVEVPK